MPKVENPQQIINTNINHLAERGFSFKKYRRNVLLVPLNYFFCYARARAPVYKM